ncbi:hypothetical protein CDAR_557511 [Caerostris darwini]|uniref:DRBM domain-containing protein n=1 Tax=Caerostris darwini TaxID=1538125 RepID=A0AAV4W101_9ARAC|nr:hypothetical protein CDAR_557511 [Caerostris darwini]
MNKSTLSLYAALSKEDKKYHEKKKPAQDPQKSDNKVKVPRSPSSSPPPRDKNGAHSGSRSPPRKKRKRAHSKSSSPDIKIIKEQKIKKKIDVPITIYGDLYCEFCDAHMNSEYMWESHIQGKRHLKNSRKSDLGAQSDSKYENIDEIPIIQSEINKEPGPIVGLDYVSEIQRLHQDPLYQCFLCSACLSSSSSIIDHLYGLKHKMAFLKKHDAEKFHLIEESKLGKSYTDSIVTECIAQHEAKSRGKITVKKEKSKLRLSSERRSDCDDYFDRKTKCKEQKKRHNRDDRDDDLPKRYRRYSSSAERNIYDGSPDGRRSRYKESFNRDNWTLMETRYGYTAPRDSSERIPNNLRDDPADRHGDLRNVLDQRRSVFNSHELSSSGKINSITNELLHLTDELTPAVFLKLALLKLEIIIIKDDEERMLLEKVIKKATSALDGFYEKLFIKKEDANTNKPPNIESNFVDNLDNFIGHYKYRKTTNENSQQQFRNNILPSKYDRSLSYNHNYVQQPTSHKSVPYQYFPTEFPFGPASSSSADYPVRTHNNVEWNPPHSMQARSEQFFSSNPSSIPGLTLTDDYVNRQSPASSQSSLGDLTTNGTGPDKKTAKRNASEAMLQRMGYSRPIISPGKPTVKSSNMELVNT